MTKIPTFFLAGEIPKSAVGDVLEAMYIAGGKRFDIRPLLAQPKPALAQPKSAPTKRIGRPPANGGLTIREKVREWAKARNESFTTKDVIAALPKDIFAGSIHSALNVMKAKGEIKAKKLKGARLKYTYVAKES